MRILVQRVTEAAVTVDGRTVGAIGAGLTVFVGISTDDTEATCQTAVEKVANWRLFPSDESKSHFDKSVTDIGGAVLVVSQFTLYGDLRKGRRPSLTEAAWPEFAEPLYDQLVARFKATGLQVATGEFGASMEVRLTNSGPATFIWES